MIELIPAEDSMAKAPQKKKKSFERILQSDPKVPLTKEQIDSTRDPLDVLIDKFPNEKLRGIESKKVLDPEKKQKDAFNRIIKDVLD